MGLGCKGGVVLAWASWHVVFASWLPKVSMFGKLGDICALALRVECKSGAASPPRRIGAGGSCSKGEPLLQYSLVP